MLSDFTVDGQATLLFQYNHIHIIPSVCYTSVDIHHFSQFSVTPHKYAGGKLPFNHCTNQWYHHANVIQQGGGVAHPRTPNAY